MLTLRRCSRQGANYLDLVGIAVDQSAPGASVLGIAPLRLAEAGGLVSVDGPDFSA